MPNNNDKTATTVKTRSAGKWIAKNKRWAIYFRDNCQCVYCGKGLADGAVLSLDHLVAWSKGNAKGKANNKHTNLVTCCLTCNSRKSDKSMRAWYKQLRGEGYSEADIKGIQKKVARARRGTESRKRAEDTLWTSGLMQKAINFNSING